MIQESPWVERKFEFELPEWMFPNVIERVRGGPARAEDAARDVPTATLITRPSDQNWSIQEHLGHLLDLEPLWSGRLSELIAGESTLRAWEVTNKASWEANHNARPLDEILSAFRKSRSDFVRQLDNLDPAIIQRTALHPRLQKPMRTIDLVFFVAEHDDHHLAVINRLKASMR